MYMVLIAAAVIFLTGAAGAIDKTKKNTVVPRTKPPAADTGKNIDKSVREQKVGDQKTGHSKYDNFIDANGNGVDDRAEKQAAAKPKPEQSADSTTAKTPKE